MIITMMTKKRMTIITIIMMHPPSHAKNQEEDNLQRVRLIDNMEVRNHLNSF